MRIQSLTQTQAWNGLSEFAWRSARGFWLALSIFMLALLGLFVCFFRYRILINPCSLIDLCQERNIWYVPYGFSKPVWFVWEVVALVIPAMIWMGLGFWVFVSKPRWVWGYAYSLFFLLGWYSEASLQLGRLQIFEAIQLFFVSVGASEVTKSQYYFVWIDLVRGTIKMMADILLFLTEKLHLIKNTAQHAISRATKITFNRSTSRTATNI